jgi:phosphoribosylaminoimidazole-succinocarboxamide synthase
MSVLAEMHAQGKVRDIYEVDQEHLVMVTSDRISAFDVVLPRPIPDKGRVLTGLSTFWFDETKNRTVSVHSELIMEALRKVYKADRLLDELRPR